MSWIDRKTERQFAGVVDVWKQVGQGKHPFTRPEFINFSGMNILGLPSIDSKLLLR